jgi:hypothetical protein
MSEELVALAESAEDRIRRENRNRKRIQRAREKAAEESENPENIVDYWNRNAADLQKKNPKLYAELVARHEFVAGLQAEHEEIAAGVRAGKRAETISADTTDPEQCFAMPDLSWRDIAADINAHGTLNYVAVEALRDRYSGESRFRPYEGERMDASATSFYRLYGWRTCLTADALRTATISLTDYALLTGDSTLDWGVVREAIRHRKTWTEGNKEFNRLLAERTKEAPLTFDQQIAKTLSDIEALGEHEIDL